MTQTVMVTGATSGFGAATARRFLQEGWRVIATGRRAERLAMLAAESDPDRIATLVFDMRDEAAMDRALASLPAAFQEIDLLVNNAGLGLGVSPAHQSDLDQWRTMIDTNITSLVTITRKLLPKLVERRGMIVNISSTAATYPYPGGNVYGGTKAFVRQFSLGLRSDLHGTGVRVTSIEPGMVETEFSLVRTGGNQTAADALYRGLHPLTAEDVANTIWWVATQPPHVNINRLEMMPVNQSWAPYQLHRDDES